MFGQNDEPGIRLGTQRQGDLAGQPKAGAAIGNPDQIVAEAVSCERFAIGGTSKVIGRVGVRVIDMGERQKPVQEGLDGGTGMARLIEAVRQVVDHLAVAHALTFEQGKHIVEIESGKVTLARSEPEPLTHRIRACRPRKSISVALAEVLPPPQLQIERSAPSLRERATSCASVVGVETLVIVSNPFLIKLNHRPQTRREGRA